jgi:N4-gp56 family major capsid protein
MANERQYGDGSDSSIGATQFNDFYWQKKALIEAKKEAYFGQLADVTSMPKHMGKKIKQYHYLPLLDDANINDQGIDAAGAISEFVATFRFLAPGIANDADVPGGLATSGRNTVYVTGEATGAAAAVTAAKLQANLISSFAKAGYAITWNTTYAQTITDIIALGWAASDDANDTIVGVSYIAPVYRNGNLYGSSKDVGVIAAKLPALSEVGGRVNRVGFRRVELEGSIEKFGFFDEYTQESMDFDTDSELMMHVNREMISGANEMTEDALQIDLLNAAGVVRFGGVATQTSEIDGENTVSVPTYEDLMRLSIDLDNNRTPKHTTLITGTRMVDTKTVQAARYMFIGSELIPMVKKMAGMDTVVGSAFTSVEKYAEAGSVARGEIGQIDQFKIIVVPEMLHWAGVGASVTTNPGYRETGGKYDVYPMLVVGDKSFTTIGFQTDGKTVKFKIKHSKPGDAISYSKDDPFGEMGFMSIKWWYGTMILRSERIAVVKCVAEY